MPIKLEQCEVNPKRGRSILAFFGFISMLKNRRLPWDKKWKHMVPYVRGEVTEIAITFHKN